MKYNLLPVAALLTVTMGIGCGGDDSSEPNGSGPSCDLVAACGGDLAGDWRITGFCPDTSKVPQQILDICETATLDYDEPNVSGTVSFKADKTFTQSASAQGTGYLVLNAACLKQDDVTLTCKDVQDLINANSGASPLTCSASGGGCRCALTVNQPANSTGTYTTSGNNLTLTSAGDNVSATYCVKGNKLYLTSNITPGSDAYQFTGQLQLEK